MPLISRDDSVLIVIDLQPAFWGERLAAGDDGQRGDGRKPARRMAGGDRNGTWHTRRRH